MRAWPRPPLPSASQFSPLEWWIKISLTVSDGGLGSSARADTSGQRPPVTCGGLGKEAWPSTPKNTSPANNRQAARIGCQIFIDSFLLVLVTPLHTGRTAPGP